MLKENGADVEWQDRLKYVSHDINPVRQLCDHAIWIDKGNVRMSGLVEEVTTEYMHMNQ
jgi:ABC-type polysaccharide/polyol phosphate transport system, ATPase component